MRVQGLGTATAATTSSPARRAGGGTFSVSEEETTRSAGAPAALRSVTSLEGLDAPWRGLEPHLCDLKVRSLLAGGVFLATGHALPAHPRRSQ